MLRYHSSVRLAACITAASTWFAGSASATLLYHYDPATGNVSFDTRGTRTGELIGYGFKLDDAGSLNFRNENFVRISNGTAFFNEPTTLSDNSLAAALAGVYTIGEVLPAGLDAATWQAIGTFNENYYGGDSYVDAIGQGAPPAADYVYGLPADPFTNRWDLIDPDTLDWATQATLVYQAWSGNVILDTTGAGGGHISTFFIRSDNLFDTTAFNPPADSLLVSRTPGAIGQAADAIAPGRYNLGAVLETGLSFSEFQASVIDASFTGRAGFGGASFDFETDTTDFALAYEPVPEPALGALSLLASTALLLPRRRSLD